LLSETDGETFYKLLDNGHELPIDWVSLYDYFDSRFADEENYAIGEITRPAIEGNTNECVRWSVMDILNFYRAEQLLPELANEIISEKKSYEYFEDFIDRGNVSSIDWTVFYEYIDTICDDGPHYRDATFVKTAEKYRKQLLDSGYDIV